jgi:DNA-binding NarL/FixJ family response regulator
MERIEMIRAFILILNPGALGNALNFVYIAVRPVVPSSNTRGGMKIFIVEDHPLMRSMLTEFIEALPDLEVCHAARTGEEALEHLPSTDPDLLLIDVSLPRMSGIDFVREVKMRWPDLPCLMLTGHQELTYVERAIDAGAAGYVIKGEPMDLHEALDYAREGKPYLSRSVRRAGSPTR